ncbi:MAG: outer membrane protein assembly factor BamE [Ehrlichia sp.]
MLARIIYIALFLLISGCSFTVMRHGYPVSEIGLWDKVKVGDSENQVVQFIGSPSIVDGNIWYYVSYNIYRKRFFSTKEYESIVLKLIFDPETKEVVEIRNIKVDKKEINAHIKEWYISYWHS